MFGLLLLSAILRHGAAVSSCDTTEKKELHECYGAVGQPLFVHLITDTTGYEFNLKDSKNKKILKFKNGNTTSYTCCFMFFNNGTLRLEKDKNFAGKYILDIYNSDGKFHQNRTIQLITEKPVSSPVVSTLCLPRGELRLSCSTTGDSPQYNWTLEDQPLGPGYFIDGNTVAILGKNKSGDITCTAWNHISRANTTVTLPTCRGLGRLVKYSLSNVREIAVQMNTSEDFSLLDNKNIFLSVGGREMLSAFCYSKPISTKTLAECWQGLDEIHL
ncbi:hypothetical protein GN956_G15011 [Arapaima gigas]